MAVVLFHANLSAVPGGFVGVDVFFVVSGFLILRGVGKEIDRSGKFNVVAFLSRRVMRILPMLLLAISVTAGLSLLILNRIDAWTALGDLRAGALHFANLHLTNAPSGYFAADQVSPALHLWSISVEEQFYFSIVVLGLLLRVRRAAPWVAIIAIITVVSFILSLTDTSPDSYYFPWTRAWELGVGGLLGLTTRKISTPLSRTPMWAGRAVGLGLILAAIVLYGPQTPFPGLSALLPVAGAAIFLAAGVGTEGIKHHSLLPAGMGQPIQTLGDISYSLYLWHWPAMVLLAAALGREIGDWNALISLVAALVVSLISYHFIERPCMNSPVHKSHPGLVIAYGVAAFLVVAAVITLVMNFIPTSGTNTSSPPVESPQSPNPSEDGNQVISMPSDSVPADLTPGLTEAGTAPVYDGDCLGVMTLEDKPSCWAGDVESDRSVVVFGDSHAAHFIPALDTMGQERGIRIMPFVANACPSLDIDIVRLPDGSEATYCQTWRPKQVQDIAALNPEMIILSNQTELYTDLTPDAAADGEQLLEQGLEGMLDALPESVPVVILSDTMTWTETPVNCLAENLDTATKCSLPRDHAPLYSAEAYESLVDERSNVRVVDMLDLTCADQCYAIQDNLLIYQDTDHLSQAFVRWLTPELDRVIFN